VACLVLVAAALGAGLTLLVAPEREAPPTASPAVPAQAKSEPRLDRYGDPLPAGAVTRLGTLRFRVPGEVGALAVRPDGKAVAVSAGDGVFLFGAAGGKRTKTFASSWSADGSENLLVFSPDGKRLAGRGHALVSDARGQRTYKGVVRVWELAGRGKPREYDAEHAVWLGWSGGGEPLAVCLEKGALRLRELAAGRSRLFAWDELPKPALSAYMACACTAAGRALAAVDSSRRAVRVWDAVSGRVRCTLRPEGDGVMSLAFAPDGTRLACGVRNGVQLWDATSAKALYTVSTKETYPAPAFSADGKLLVVMDSWRAITFREAATGRELGRTPGGCVLGKSFGLSADGKTLAASEYHCGAFHLFDVPTGKPRPEPAGHRSRPHGTAFAADGRVATGGSLDGTIHVWDVASGASLLRIQRQPEWVRDIAFSPDGRLLFATWTDDNLWVCDAATGERQHVLKLEDPDRPDTYQSAISMHLSADGKRLVAFSYYYPRKNQGGPHYQETLITGWDARTRKQLFRRRRSGIDSWHALSPDGRVLAVTESAGRLFGEKDVGPRPMRLEDVATGELVLTFPALDGQTWPLAFSPDGRLLAAAHDDGKPRPAVRAAPPGPTRNTLRLLETATAAEVLALPTVLNARTAFSADGRLLAVVAPAQEVLVWDLARGRELRRFKGFGADVTWLAFAPDGRRLVSGQNDSTLLVWDVGPRPAASKLGPARLAKAWANLAGADAARAFRARWDLASSPEEAVALLKDRLHPAPPADRERLLRLLAGLGSDLFTVRAKAQAELEAIGDPAEPALRQALEDKVTLEVRRRVQSVLARLRGPVTRPEVLRPIRAVAVLENIATPAARQLLTGLAAGASGARLTREAQAALNRLDRRPPAEP
jgi:WD40 repeat protein